MCLPDFIEYKRILEKDAVTGYRGWYLDIKNENAKLKSLNVNFIWEKKLGSHKVTENNSGIFSYNNNINNNNYYNYYNNNNYNYNYYYYNNYNKYYIAGIIKQHGKVAFHQTGYRSQYAILNTLFNIRKSDAVGSKEFLDWVDKFNNRIELLAKYYNCKIISWQDFREQNKSI